MKISTLTWIIQRMLSRQLVLNDASVAEMAVADNKPFCQDVVGTTVGSVSRRIVVAGKQLLFEELMVQL
jgi:hypothetical protein